MRIGIITQPLHTNYGGLLQNFALQKVLRDDGHEPVTIDWWMSRYNSLRSHASIVKNSVMGFLTGKSFKHQYQPTAYENKVICQNTDKFIERYITHTEKVTESKDFMRKVKTMHLDALIVGSDQVWRPNYALGHINDMFFDFLGDSEVKRIAYAASFGTDKWEFSPEQTACCKALAEKFNLITVREQSGVKLCEDYFNVSATHVLDPTMLLDRHAYEQVVADCATPKSNGNLFHYILDPSAEKTNFINSIAEENGLIPFTVMPTYQAENRTKDNVRNEIEKCVFPGVNSWLRAFMDAEMVICDSFHGCVFSIIFNKPFWVIGNSSRGNARFESLLGMFGLRDRLIEDFNHLDHGNVIRWDAVNAVWNEKKISAMNMLLENLK